MKFIDLSPEMIEQIRALRFDRILEKHEGPFGWASILEHYEPEFMRIESYGVLLPVGADDHAKIEITRTIPSQDGKVLTLFLKDNYYNPGGDMEMFYVGRIAICEKMASAEFYVATVYHEWFVIENEGLA